MPVWWIWVYQRARSLLAWLTLVTSVVFKAHTIVLPPHSSATPYVWCVSTVQQYSVFIYLMGIIFLRLSSKSRDWVESHNQGWLIECWGQFFFFKLHNKLHWHKGWSVAYLRNWTKSMLVTSSLLSHAKRLQQCRLTFQNKPYPYPLNWSNPHLIACLTVIP